MFLNLLSKNVDLELGEKNHILEEFVEELSKVEGRVYFDRELFFKSNSIENIVRTLKKLKTLS